MSIAVYRPLVHWLFYPPLFGSPNLSVSSSSLVLLRSLPVSIDFLLLLSLPGPNVRFSDPHLRPLRPSQRLYVHAHFCDRSRFPSSGSSSFAVTSAAEQLRNTRHRFISILARGLHSELHCNALDVTWLGNTCTKDAFHSRFTFELKACSSILDREPAAGAIASGIRMRCDACG
jgi:hypothetical protein